MLEVPAIARGFRTALADERALPELGGAIAWLNSAPLNRKSLRGQVVLVNFWTYSCINSLRELPYLQTQASRYRDAGLVVIGVHTPEFSFEKERSNVERAVHELKVAFPVAVDSDHTIWERFTMNTGRRITSSIGGDEFVTTTSAKATTVNASSPFASF